MKFKNYRYSSSRFVENKYQLIGFCDFDLDNYIIQFDSKFHIHFIDFTRKSFKLFSENTWIEIDNFSIIQWV